MLGSIQHWSHPQHSLSYVQHGKPYICDGCEIWGQASSYRCCTNCDFDLHKSCATAPPVFSHGFHSGQGHFLQLHRSPPRGTPMCAGCAQPVSAFGYHCTSIDCGYSLHPSCATLPQNPPDPANRSQLLHLQQILRFPCYVCGQQGLGWAYVAASGHYNFHVACAGSMLKDSNHIEVRTQPHDTELKSDGTRDVQISSLRTGPPPASLVQQSGGGTRDVQISSLRTGPPPASLVQQSGGGTRDVQISSLRTGPPPASLVQQSGGGTRERRIYNLNTSPSSAPSGEIPGPSSYTASPAQQSGEIPGPSSYTASPAQQSGEIAGPSSYTASPAQQSGRRRIGWGTFWTVGNLLCELTTGAITGDSMSIVGEMGKLFHDEIDSDN